MHIKFLGRGTGSGSGAIDYVLSDKDHTKAARPHQPQVLRGDPSAVAELADSLEFKSKYSSAVIAWHPDDKPTDDQISEVLDGFEKVAFAGLDHDQYTWTAVLHREQNSEHIHVIIPRVELSTGKSFNPAPPGWQRDFDPLRDYFNAKYQWASPDISLEPNRARVTQPELDALRKGTRAEIKKTIEQYLLSEIEAGNIENREDIIQTLQGLGFEIPRKGKDYITILHSESDTRIRLRGAIYEQHWKFERTLETENIRATERDRNACESRARAAYSELESRISKRAEYNISRYPRPEPELTTRTDRDKKHQRDTDQRDQKTGDTRLDQAQPDSYNDLDNYLIEQLGADAIPLEKNSDSVSVDRAEPADAENAGQPGRLDQVQSLREKRETMRPNRRISTAIQRWLQNFKRAMRAEYDRVRAAFNYRIRKFIESVQTGYDKFRKADRHLSTASAELERAKQNTDRELQRGGQVITRGVRAVRENRSDELERFKTQINLVEYAASFNYRIDRKSSSVNSKVMKSPAGEKIVIMTDQDGHGIYFNVNDKEADSGSIIDFHQKRTGDNLGQTRKALRQFGGFADVQDYKAYTKPARTDKNTAQVAHAYASAEFTDSHPYLLQERKISAETLRDSRFAQSVKIDRRGNALFPHYNGSGISGYEIKNTNFTGFAKGGTRGVWYSANITRADRVVIVESAIDALSHAELKKTGQETAYISIAGSMSPAQLELIKRLSDRQVIIATDNDTAGNKYAKQIKEVIPTAEREIAQGKDWNADLQAQHEQEQSRGFDLEM